MPSAAVRLALSSALVSILSTSCAPAEVRVEPVQVRVEPPQAAKAAGTATAPRSQSSSGTPEAMPEEPFTCEGSYVEVQDGSTVHRFTRGRVLVPGVRGAEHPYVQSRPLLSSSEEWNEVAQHRERIERWLAGDKETRPLRLTKVHTLLVRDHALQTSYGTLRRFAMHELGWRKKQCTVRVDDPPPGQEAQVDFGKMGMLLDAETGRRRTLWALIVTLSFSRYQFVWPTFLQTTEAVCEGLDRAWMFFAAMAVSMIPDNTKAMIKDPDALSPTLVASFLDYVQARGLFVDPARVRSPKDKPRVENQVPYVRESWFDGETFAGGLEDARQSAEHWCREIAGTRVHGTTRQIPRELFESVEKPAMLPPPDALFDVPLWNEKVKVHPDHHIQVAHALYSVPNLYLRSTCLAVATRPLATS